MKRRKNKKSLFEQVRDAVLSTILPFFLGYLVLLDFRDGSLSDTGLALVVILAAICLGSGAHILELIVLQFGFGPREDRELVETEPEETDEEDGDQPED